MRKPTAEETRALLDVSEASGVPMRDLAAGMVRAGQADLAVPPPARATRQKAPAKRTRVERVTDPESGAWVDVFFNAGTRMFEANVSGFPDTIMGREADPVIERTREVLRATRGYQWKPSIVVDAGRGGTHWDPDTAGEEVHHTRRQTGRCELDVADATLAVRFYRLEIAPKPGDPSKFVCRPHADDVVARDAGREAWMRADATERRARGEDVGDFLERSRAVVLPYTPETWAAVQQVVADVLAVGERLRALLARPEALTEVGARLLAAAPEALALPEGRDP